MPLKWPDVLRLAKEGNPAPDRKVIKTEAEWRQQLSPEEFHVTRQAGTEHPFSSQMCGLFEPGIYSCVCCETVLFDASEKFESGTGWPSFTQRRWQRTGAGLLENRAAPHTSCTDQQNAAPGP